MRYLRYMLPVAVAAAASKVFAQGGFPATSPIQNEADVVRFVNSVADWLLGILGLLAVLALLYSGFLFMTGGASDERQKQAKSWLKWGIVGIIIVVLSKAMVSLVASFLV